MHVMRVVFMLLRNQTPNAK